MPDHQMGALGESPFALEPHAVPNFGKAAKATQPASEMPIFNRPVSQCGELTRNPWRLPT